jgi:hypothetical protein
MVRMGESYRKFLDESGITQEDFQRMVVEATASHVKYLTRHSAISLHEFLAIEHPTAEAMQRDLLNFKRLLFFSLLMAADSLEEIVALKHEWQSERNRLENSLAQIFASRSWQLTKPLRQAMRILNGSG